MTRVFAEWFRENYISIHFIPGELCEGMKGEQFELLGSRTPSVHRYIRRTKLSHKTQSDTTQSDTTPQVRSMGDSSVEECPFIRSLLTGDLSEISVDPEIEIGSDQWVNVVTRAEEGLQSIITKHTPFWLGSV